MVSHVGLGDMEETCCSYDLDEEVICYGEEEIFFHEDCSVDCNSDAHNLDSYGALDLGYDDVHFLNPVAQLASDILVQNDQLHRIHNT